MDQNIQKALWLGVSILLFIGIVSTGLSLYNKGRGIAEKSGQEMDDVSKVLEESNYAAFDNTTVSGSDVLNEIKNKRNKTGELIILVKTKKSSNYYVSSGSIAGGKASGLGKLDRTKMDTQIKNARDTTNSSYINPTAKFDAQLAYDENDVIKGIMFTQE